MKQESVDVTFAVETTYMVVIGGIKRRMTREQAQRLAGQLNAALGTGRTVAPKEDADEGGGQAKYGPWSAQDTQFLKTMLAAGRPVENIAATLKRTVASCQKRMDDIVAEAEARA